MYTERILRAYEQLTAAQLSPQSDYSDCSAVIFNENGVRIILTRSGELIELDVEISGPSPKMVKGYKNEQTTEVHRKVVTQTIRLLEFLVSLIDHGFSLNLLDSEFLWVANIVLIEPPSQKLLELLSSIESLQSELS